jgi:tetratricopeptide (TPR) repeat protein
MAGFVGDMAAARALELHPDDPRMLVQLANAWLRMREATGLPYALGERATVALARAVAMDGWRAEEAFQLARAVSPASVDRIGAAASDEPVSRSRTLYQYGIVLEEEGRRQDARRVEEESANADPQYGPPAFRAGLLAKLAGDAVASEGWMRRFLASRDRPVAMEGWALYHLGESSAAEVRFRRAVAVAPKNRWAWEGLASVARQKEDERAETDAWTRVLAITPGHPLAVDRLRELGRIE